MPALSSDRLRIIRAPGGQNGTWPVCDAGGLGHGCLRQQARPDSLCRVQGERIQARFRKTNDQSARPQAYQGPSRSGSATFSTSGKSAQDNDLIVIRGPGAASKFEAHFERMWDAAERMVEFGPAIEAMEPR